MRIQMNKVQGTEDTTKDQEQHKASKDEYWDNTEQETRRACFDLRCADMFADADTLVQAMGKLPEHSYSKICRMPKLITACLLNSCLPILPSIVVFYMSKGTVFQIYKRTNCQPNQMQIQPVNCQSDNPCV